MRTGAFVKLVGAAAVAVVFGGIGIMGCGGDGNGNPTNGVMDDPPTATYTLTTNANPAVGGTVSPAGTSTHDSGAMVSITATAANGYVFVNWTGAGVASTNSATTTISMSQNRLVTANFRLLDDDTLTHRLTVNASPEIGGTVSRVPNQERYDANTQITVVATHAEGYVFTGWTGAPSSVNAQNSSITFNITANMTLTANFEPVTITHELTTNANPLAGGTVTPSGTVTRNAGTSVTVTATEAEGYEFISWTGAPSTVDASNKSITFNIDDDMTLIANFRQINTGTTPITYTLSTDITPTGGGAVTRTPNLAVFDAETEVTLTATANTGFEFVGWTGSLSSTDRIFTFKMLSDMSMTANFKRVYTLTTNAMPTAGGSIIRTPNKTTYDVDEIVTVTAAPASGYEFTGWSGASTSTNPQIEISMDANKTLIANFVRVYTLTVNRNLVIGGTVTRSPDQVTYTHGSTVTVSATPSEGYRFTGWSGASTSTSSEITITMDANKTLTANFELITYTLTTNATPTAGGSITRSPNQTNYNHGTTVTVSATAAENYRFIGWSGASTSNTSPVTITMDENKTLTANFEFYPFNPNITYGSFTDSRDGKTYRTVVIGSQTWMAENLNYTPSSGNSWCYGNVADSCAKYGRLYDWATSMNIGTTFNSSLWSGSDVRHQGICPTGWWLPSDDDWNELTGAVGDWATAGTKLKSSTGWEPTSSTPVGTDDFGFSALPGGGRWDGYFFDYIGSFSDWWTATEYDATGAVSRTMSFNGENVTTNWYYKSGGFSVRCVRY